MMYVYELVLNTKWWLLLICQRAQAEVLSRESAKYWGRDGSHVSRGECPEYSKSQIDELVARGVRDIDREEAEAAAAGEAYDPGLRGHVLRGRGSDFEQRFRVIVRAVCMSSIRVSPTNDDWAVIDLF